VEGEVLKRKLNPVGGGDVEEKDPKAEVPGAEIPAWFAWELAEGIVTPGTGWTGLEPADLSNWKTDPDTGGRAGLVAGAPEAFDGTEACAENENLGKLLVGAVDGVGSGTVVAELPDWPGWPAGLPRGIGAACVAEKLEGLGMSSPGRTFVDEKENWNGFGAASVVLDAVEEGGKSKLWKVGWAAGAGGLAGAVAPAVPPVPAVPTVAVEGTPCAALDEETPNAKLANCGAVLAGAGAGAAAFVAFAAGAEASAVAVPAVPAAPAFTMAGPAPLGATAPEVARWAVGKIGVAGGLLESGGLLSCALEDVAPKLKPESFWDAESDGVAWGSGEEDGGFAPVLEAAGG